MERDCLQVAIDLTVDVPREKHDILVSNYQLSFEDAQAQNAFLCQYLAGKAPKYCLA